MSTRLSASSTLRAVLLSLVALGILVLLVATGGGGDEGPEQGSEVPDGFRVLAGGEVYDAILDAQREAGSWQMTQQTESGGRAGQPITSEVTWDGDAVASRITVQDPAGQLEATYVDKSLYIKGLASERPWWKVSLRADDPLGGAIAGLLTLADPEKQAGAWADPDEFEVVGAEDVEDQEALHYRIGVSARKYFESLGVAAGAEQSQFAEDDRFVFDLWLDERDQPLRVRTTSAVDGSEAVTEATYTGYGTDLEIAAPPAGQVTTRTPDLQG